MAYSPTTWSDEVPNTSPLRYKITLNGGTVLAADATIELITPVTAGTPVNATNLNKLEQGIAKARCEVLQVRKTATDSDPVDNGWKKLAWGTEDFDDWNGHSPTVENSKITIAEAGVYLLMGDLRYTTGQSPLLQFIQNGSVVWDGEAWILNGTRLIPNLTLPAGGGASVGKQFYTLPFALQAGNSIELWLADGITFYTDSILSLIKLR